MVRHLQRSWQKAEKRGNRFQPASLFLFLSCFYYEAIMETFPSNKMLNTVYDFAYKGLEKKVKDAVDENPSLVTVPDGVSFIFLVYCNN